MSLLEMSFSGAVLILMIVVVRAVAIHRFPKKIFLALWIMAIARLLLPFSVPVPVPVPAPVDVYSPTEENTADFSSAHTAVSESHQPTYGIVIAGDHSTTAANTPQTAQAAPFISVWTAIWIAGMTILAGIFLLSYVRSKWEFRTALPIQNENITAWLNEHRLKRKIEIRQFSGITAPMTYRLFRPVILLPKNTDPDNKQQLEYILFHEYVHIRHYDTALKFLAAAALCIHWFNPLVWVLFILFNRDIELACDECVIRRFGADNRSAYAKTLISMEERKSFAAPFCNNFSKNAIEERIVAIMKTKKASAAALFAAGVVVAAAAGAFVTSVQANENNTSAVQSYGTGLSFTQTNGNDFPAAVGTEMEVESILITRVDEDGTTYYSRDGGATWTALTDEELEQYFSITGIEWWTYEEYAEWLENEKVELQSMIGERGWTSGRGEFVWTQEIIDEAIARYEEILENIKNGMLYSKMIDGEGDQLVMSFDPANIAVSIQEGAATAADFSEYAPFGLVWDEDKKALFFNGEHVRYFVDGAEVGGGMAIRLEYADAKLEGEIDVHTVREPAENADGSFDPMGKLTGLEKYSQEEFDARTFSDSSGEFTYLFQSFSQEELGAAETEELLKAYVPFGLSYEFDHDGGLSMSWQGKTVHSVFDGVKEVWIANNLHGYDLGDEAVDLEAVYEQGKLVGLQETQALHATETSFITSADNAAYGKLLWPVNGGYISEWGYWDGGYSGHSGIDIAGVNPGDPVYAGADGVVTYAGWNHGLGNYVEIYHPDLGISSCYAHNSGLYVSEGQQVAQGERIAGAGSTGLAAGTCVHLAVKVNGVNVNPREYLDYSGHCLAEVGDTLTAEQGETLAQRFEKYAPFGITYEEGEGLGNVYYNGRLVGKFADLTPEGGAFTFSSAKGGGINVRTVYDENGRLTGVETAA